MKGSCSKCTVNMDPPKIMVLVQDLDNGVATGYFCNYECAIENVTNTMKHISDVGDMDGSPDTFEREPIFIEKPVIHEKGTVIDVGVNAATQPPYDHETYRSAAKCAYSINASLSKQMLGTWQNRGEVWSLETTVENTETHQGFKLPYTQNRWSLNGKDFWVEVGHDDTKVWVNFPNEKFNLTVDPKTFGGPSHHDFVSQQIEVLVANAPEAKTIDKEATKVEKKAAFFEYKPTN